MIIVRNELLDAIRKHVAKDGHFDLAAVAKDIGTDVGSIEYGKALHQLEIEGIVKWKTPTHWIYLDR